MAEANSTALDATDIANKFFQLRAFAMCADALITESHQSDEELVVGYVLRIIMEKAEEYANMCAGFPIDGGGHA